MKYKINNTALNVFEAGVENYNKTRPTLFFLHYFGGSSRAWTEVIEHLESDYHCVAPDMRGFGASDAPAENYAVKDYAEDAADLISVLRLENYALVGHSMGGKIALALAARNLVGLQTLILLAPSPLTPEPIPDEKRKKSLNSRGNQSAAAETIRQASGGKLSGAVFERSVNDNLRTSDAAWKWWLESGSREDISSEVGRINVPVLVAAGEKDEVMTPKLLEREVVRRIDNARLVVVPGVNHLLPLEAPLEIANLIRQQCEIHTFDEKQVVASEKTASKSEVNPERQKTIIEMKGKGLF